MFTKNIKIKYNNNLINNLIKHNDFKEINTLLKNIYEKDKSMLIDLLKANLFKMLEVQDSISIFPSNIIWVNSFDLNDTNILNKFLTFYFHKISFQHSPTKVYSEAILEIFDEIQIKGDIKFSELKDFSYVYQYLISLQNIDKCILLNSDLAFFESNLGRYFTHYYLSKCYFYVIKNPVTVLKDIKNKNPDFDSQSALNLLLNRDGQIPLKYNSDKNRYIEENKQGWHTNVTSWTQANVLNTFRGFSLKIEDLILNPKDKFTDIIGHLIQVGLNIKLNYEIIDEFIEQNSQLLNMNIEAPIISNQEAKLFKRDIGTLVNNLKYKI